MNKLTKQGGKSLFPEPFMEDLSASDDEQGGGVDFEVLRQLLGDVIDEGEKKHGEELGLNGYEVFRGKHLKSFKLTVKEQFDTYTDIGIKTQLIK